VNNTQEPASSNLVASDLPRGIVCRCTIRGFRGFADAQSARQDKPAMAREFIQDPDNAASALFHRELEQMASTLKRIDQAKDAASSANLTDTEKSARLARIAKARENLLRNADGLDSLLFNRKQQGRARQGNSKPASGQPLGQIPGQGFGQISALSTSGVQ
jgi:hypothetical protein